MEDLNPILLTIFILSNIAAFFSGPRTPSGTRYLLSAYNTVIILFFFYVSVSGSLAVFFNGGRFTWAEAVSDPGYIAEAIAICWLSLLTFSGSYAVATRIHGRGNAHPTHAAPSALPRRNPEHIAFMLVILGVLLKVYVIQAGGGIENAILQMSGGIRDSLKLDQISSFLINVRVFSGIADAGATWLLLTALQRRARVSFSALIFFFVLGLTFLGTAKRLFLLWPVLVIAVGYSTYVRPIRNSAAPLGIVAVLLVGFLTLLVRVFLPASAANVTLDLGAVGWGNGSLIGFYLYSLEFSTFEMITLSIVKASAVANMFGGSVSAFYITNIQPFFYTVPRLVWPGKPEMFFDISHAITGILTGLPLSAVRVGVASTLIGSSWAIAGIFGMALAMAVLGFFCARVDRRMSTIRVWNRKDVVVFAFLLTVVFHFFRQGTIGWVFMITVVQQLGIILGFWIILRSAKSLQISVPYHPAKSVGLN